MQGCTINCITVSLSPCSKEWPSSHKEWVELVKKQVESHDLETERLDIMMCVTRGKWVNIAVYTFVLYVYMCVMLYKYCQVDIRTRE